MSIIDPNATTLGDLCIEALRECGAFGLGQTPLADDVNGAAFRLQTMLQQWQRKRWFVYHLVDLAVTSTGQSMPNQPYTVGPGAQYNTGLGSTRPDRVERAYMRQLVLSQPNQIDYPLELLQSKEDYANIALKGLKSFPTAAYYDPDWPTGKLFIYPVPQANLYAVHILVRAQLPQNFSPSAGNTWLTTPFEIPFEYYGAMLYNLAVRLRPKYQLPSWPGDPLPGLAKDALNVLREANTQIARLTMPADLLRDGLYNIFNDRFY
jgi:hypothetical protein